MNEQQSNRNAMKTLRRDARQCWRRGVAAAGVRRRAELQAARH